LTQHCFLAELVIIYFEAVNRRGSHCSALMTTEEAADAQPTTTANTNAENENAVGTDDIIPESNGDNNPGLTNRGDRVAAANVANNGETNANVKKV